MKNTILGFLIVLHAILNIKPLFAQKNNNINRFFAVIDVIIEPPAKAQQAFIQFEMIKNGINSHYSRDIAVNKTDLQKAKTRVILPLSSPIQYGRINYNNIGDANILSKRSNLFLFQNRDTVQIYIKEDQIKFEGKDAEKFTFMYDNYNLSKIDYGYYDELNSKGRFKNSINLKRHLIDSALRVKIDRLRELDRYIDPQASKLIYLDLVGKYELSFVNSLQNLAVYPDYREAVFDLAKNEFIKNYNPDFYKKFNDSLITGSYYFSNFLLKKEIYSARLNKNSKYDKTQKKETVEEVLDLMRDNYKNGIRDKLILELFYYMGQRKEITEQNINNALNITNGSKFKKALELYTSRNYGSIDAFPFELTNANGDTIRLKDFKGKLIVMDFWFTGCGGCMSLTRKLTPIIKDLKENKNVVFVSVSIDKKKEIWLKSSTEGKYSPKNAFHLYTNGKGANHPLIKYYNIMSYPTLIVISKDGKTITTNPPRLRTSDPNNELAFRELIRNNSM